MSETTEAPDDDEIIDGPCGICKQERELVVTMTVTIGGHSTDLDVCEQCALKTLEEMTPSAGKIVIGYDGGATETITREERR
jgi:hypothetical protein